MTRHRLRAPHGRSDLRTNGGTLRFLPSLHQQPGILPRVTSVVRSPFPFTLMPPVMVDGVQTSCYYQKVPRVKSGLPVCAGLFGVCPAGSGKTLAEL